MFGSRLLMASTSISAPFSPLDLYASSEVGAWYDPSDFLPNWRLNVLTYTEQFDNAAWTKTASSITANADTGPDTTTTADKIIPSATTAKHWVGRNLSFGAGYTVTIYAKAAEYYKIGFAEYQNSAAGSNIVDLRDGSIITATAAVGTTTATSVGNGWYRITWTPTFGVIVNNGFGVYVVPNTATTGYYIWSDSWTPDGTSGLLIWGADIRLTSDASTAPLYQRITDGVADYFDAKPVPVMYQDNAGITPVSAFEQPVGLILDKSKGLVLGTELVTNGDFSGGSTNWTLGTGVAIAGGVATFTSVAAAQDSLYQLNVVTIGKRYRVSFDITSYTSGSVQFQFGAQVSVLRSAVGTYTFDLMATPFGNANLVFKAGAAGTTLSIDNISVREVQGNHLTQATAASRPVLSAKYNILTFTEEFDNAAWSKVFTTITANNTTGPVGLGYADKLVEDTSTNQHYTSYATSILAGSLVYTIHAKLATGTRYLQLRPGGLGGGKAYANFDLSTGTVVSGGTGGTEFVSATITAVANGFYRCTMVANHAAAPTSMYVMLSNTSAEVPSYLGDGTSSIYLWGADLRYANDGVGLPVYQRVNAATSYNTTGFPPYLKFDGVDDSLATAAINFSATNKMSVFAGIRKLNDAAQGVVAELTASVAANSGGFLLAAPNAAATANYNFASDGTAQVDNIITTYTAPLSNVVTGLADIAAPSNIIRVNGAQVGTPVTTSQGTGNYANAPLYIGRRGGTTLSYNGRLYSLIVRGAATSGQQLTDTETWVNSKTKAY
jgi:hypothetical protein